MAGRKRNSAEDIVRKLRRADELAAEGKTGEEIAAELQVSPATLYNWRRTYGGMDTDAAKELKELRDQNARLKRLLADAELEKDALREVAKGKILSPAAKRRAVDMLKETLGMSERLACKAVGLARSTYRRLPLAQTPTDPDADMRAWLRGYATKHPCHGFRRAWAALRYDERREVNKKKIHRLWREEGLQVKVVSPRKRAGVSSVPPILADAPKVVWAIDFQFDSTIDGKAIKIASMIDEHTRESLLNVVERSITGERLVEELTKVFAARGGPPKVLRMDNGPEMVSQALQRFCENKTGMVYIPPGCPWDNGYIESFNNRLRKECLNRNYWNTLFEARVVIGDFKHEHNHRHR
ncbi:IS3 family transposase, partial [Mycobacterium sp. WUMAC-025]